MYVLMMRVMHVRMSMFHRLVLMLVLVVFGQVQPDTERHQQAGQNQLCSDRFMQHCNGSDRSKERRRREVRAGSCGPEMAKRDYKQDEAHAISEEPNKTCNQ